MSKQSDPPEAYNEIIQGASELGKICQRELYRIVRLERVAHSVSGDYVILDLRTSPDTAVTRMLEYIRYCRSTQGMLSSREAMASSLRHPEKPPMKEKRRSRKKIPVEPQA